MPDSCQRKWGRSSLNFANLGYKEKSETFMKTTSVIAVITVNNRGGIEHG